MVEEEISEITGKMKEFLRIMLLRIHDFLLWIVVEKKVAWILFFVKSENFYGISVDICEKRSLDKVNASLSK